MFNKELYYNNIEIKNKLFQKKMNSFQKHIEELGNRKCLNRKNSEKFNMVQDGARNLYEKINDIKISRKQIRSYADEIIKIGESLKKICMDYLEEKEGKYYKKNILTGKGRDRRDSTIKIYYDLEFILSDIEPLKQLDLSHNNESDETLIKIGDLILQSDSSKRLLTNSQETNTDPESLKYFDNSIIKSFRFVNPVIRKKIEDLLREAIKSNDFCMNVPNDSSIIKSIVMEHFKNQFETGIFKEESEDRIKASKTMFSWNDGIDTKNLEKYGYLSNTNEITAVMFGPVKFKFKKSNLFTRTTFTVGDSSINCGEVFPRKVSDPKIEAMPGIVSGNMKSALGLYYKIIRDPNRAKFFIENPSKIDPQQNYIELQYHGKLTFNDVEQVTLLKKLDKDETEVIKEGCRDKNIPVIEK